MKEKDLDILRGLSFEQLVTMDETLCMPEYEGTDVSDVRKAIFDEINARRPYGGATRGELDCLSFNIQRLIDEKTKDGEEGSSIDALRASKEKVDKERWSRVEHGIIYERYPSRPNKEDAV